MRRRDWRDDERYNNEDNFSRRDNNFDRMYDARQYSDNNNFSRYDRQDRQDNFRGRENYRDNMRPNPRYEEEYHEEPKKRSFFGRGIHRKDREEIGEVQPQGGGVGANQFVVMTPKNFDDIRGIIDNLKIHRALVVDLCRLNDDSVQRVMDYINGAIYALDGSIQRINPGVFLLTPTGMGISVPIDYIKDKLERNKRK